MIFLQDDLFWHDELDDDFEINNPLEGRLLGHFKIHLEALACMQKNSLGNKEFQMHLNRNVRKLLQISDHYYSL